MLIIDLPYVSDLLGHTLLTNQFPVLKTPDAVMLLPKEGIHFISEKEAIEKYKTGEIPTIYTSSENSIGWIAKNLSFSELPEKVELFKNKLKFRKLVSALYPDFYFREVDPDKIEDIDYGELPKPFIIKPNVGFFSLGVHQVSSPESWEKVKIKIREEAEVIKDTYPKEVLDTAKFIIEEIIEGEEYTIDAFYDKKGEPVILGMMHHLFSGEADTSDRLYTTSSKVLSENMDRFMDFLRQLGNLAGLKNFPIHLEVRVDDSGRIMPIEGNPLRYGGWCTSAELTHYAFGFNPYEYVMLDKKPDWKTILEHHSGNSFSIIILNNNSGIAAGKIARFDYEKLTGRLGKVLELRKADVVKFHVFGFVFAETTPDHFDELEQLLHADLREFIIQ
ncbi:MAG: ATP-grasp domain-containing protein [Bacteroidetes bacterium]|nr:ATP-grasp domain-containing protein [Bacteroidota bacterium]